MAASIAGALKALLESLGLGISVYRDAAPAGQPLPYATVRERISVTKSLSGRGDFGDPASKSPVEEQVQVDVWQQWRNPATGALAETYTLARAVTSSLDGAVLPSPPMQVHGVRLASAVRFVEDDNNLVHDAITVVVHRAA